MSVGIVPPLAGSVATSADLPPSDGGTRRRPSVKWQLLGLAVVWIVLYKLLDGKWPLESGVPENAQAWLQDFSSTIGDGRLTNPLFIYVLNPITDALQAAYDGGVWITQQLGWTGMTGLATAVALVLAGWRMALLTFLGFLSFGIVGLWDASMETLVLVAISVLLAVIIGIPLGVWAGLSPRFERFLIPVLDTLQIMPSLAYLPFITLFFLIGPPSGIVATLIYAVPPVIRLTSVGIREVAPESVEASRSLGATARQVLFGVQLPMSRRTRVVGINQTVMAALSMVTIAALVAAPGLGQSVVNALVVLNVGAAFNAGIALVIMAIVLDRVITAASRRVGSAPPPRRSRLISWGVAAALVVVGAVLPAVIPALAKWNAAYVYAFTDWVNSLSDWAKHNLYPITTAFTEWFTTWFINPLDSLFAGTPWFITIAMWTALGFILGRFRPAFTALFCLLGVVLLALWPSSMTTLTQVIIAAAITMVLGLVFGVWIGRSRWADRILRPILDAGQVMPPFVYLIPCLFLFGPTRFTAIVAAVIYAAPAAIKIVGEGIDRVPSDSVEAARSVGSTTVQEIVKVQLPMARPIILVALNQGIIFVMSMVVIGGLVGGGGLGYDVITGFAQERFAGLGLAAGVAIVLLGVMLDRISQSAGRVRRTSSDLA
ncbi:MAG TPA: ABC transporter permease subunit [Candidatus Nanopelagicales bacterium]|nr:ABC transporter permease subunit [Candidatus Nanopelagicales bacterium]